MFQNYGSCISCGVIRDILIFKFYNSLIITENTAKEKEESRVFYLSREDSHLFQVVSDSKFVSVGVQYPTEINAPRGCAVIL